MEKIDTPYLPSIRILIEIVCRKIEGGRPVLTRKQPNSMLKSTQPYL